MGENREGWWLASDGKWYPPQPDAQAARPDVAGVPTCPWCGLIDQVQRIPAILGNAETHTTGTARTTGTSYSLGSGFGVHSDRSQINMQSTSQLALRLAPPPKPQAGCASCLLPVAIVVAFLKRN